MDSVLVNRTDGLEIKQKLCEEEYLVKIKLSLKTCEGSRDFFFLPNSIYHNAHYKLKVGVLLILSVILVFQRNPYRWQENAKNTESVLLLYKKD